MNVDDQVRELCDRALSSRDPAEVSEMILSQVRALLHEHVARIRKLVAERRRRSELEQPSDIAMVERLSRVRCLRAHTSAVMKLSRTSATSTTI